MSPPYAADPTITANTYVFHVWNGATLSLDLFATPDTPLKCNDQELGGEQKAREAAKNAITRPYDPNLRSNYMTIHSEFPVNVRLEVAQSRGIIRFNRSSVDFAYYRYKNDSVAANTYTKDDLHRLGKIKGQDGSSFTLAASDSKGERDCTGAFKAFNGQTLLSWPPQYVGEGANGVIRLMIETTPNVIMPIAGNLFPSVAEQVQAIHVTALENTKIGFGLPINSVAVRGLNDTEVTYHGVPHQVADTDLLDVEFDRNTPGKFVVDGNEKRVVISGPVDHIKVNDENITPRYIDDWPWYAQMLFGVILAILAEHLFISWRTLRATKQERGHP